MVSVPQICDRDQGFDWSSLDNQEKWSEVEECSATADQREEKYA